MVLQTNITHFKTPEELNKAPKKGVYIHGLLLEGAAWKLGNTNELGYLIDQKPRELNHNLPIVNIVAVSVKENNLTGEYECPVYVTSMKGRTFVFAANLRMNKENIDKNHWIIAGTCLIMSDD